MAKSGSSSRSKWAQFGLGGKSRDADLPGAPAHVSEDAQPRSIDKKAANLAEFNSQHRDRLPERPSTSAGPASSFTKRKNAEKRETQDDLLYNPLGSHGRGTTFYNFPLPGSLPTPASSPKSLAPSTHKSSLYRPSTPESMEITPAPSQPARMNVPQGQIGMALGSPSHAPATWQEHSVETYIRHESPDHMDGSVDGSWDNSAPQKSKSSRWKVFGGMFGGGKKAQPAFYQLQPDQPQQKVVEAFLDNIQEPASSEKRPKSRGRGWSNSTRRKNKPDMTRANTTPAFNMSGGRDAMATPEIMLDGGPLLESASRMTRKGAGLLDVDIPSVQMERYSIMFSGVLQKPQQTSSSSLLARRQATLDKLKTVNEALASKEQEIEAKQRLLLPRRATSPGLRTQSPAFSLFPNTPSRRDQSPSSRHLGSSSLHRSNTSPAALSPSRPKFAPGLDNETHAKLMSNNDTSPEKKTTKPKHDNGRLSTASPTPKSTPWSPSKSHLTLDDASDVDDNEGESRSASNITSFPMKPKLVEPDWQIINPHTTTPSVSGSATSESTHSTSTSNSSNTSTPATSGLPTKPNMPSPPLTSSTSPKAQAQARARALSSNVHPPTTRSRSATTTTTTFIPQQSQPHAETIDSPTLHPEPIRSLSSTISPSTASAPKSRSKPPPSQPRPSTDSSRTSLDQESEAEARLTSLANVSIARQISVSRQQRQLLVPIKTSLKSASSNGSLKRSPSGMSAGGNGASIVNVSKAASPLTAVAVAASEERERTASPFGVRREGDAGVGKGMEKGKERLVESVVKPSTPTLVVVGEGMDKQWEGATQQLKSANPGLAERRRMLAQNAAGGTGNQSGGETVKVGLVVSTRERERKERERGERGRAEERDWEGRERERERERERDRAVRARERELRELQKRKSERVVVERVSVVST